MNIRFPKKNIAQQRAARLQKEIIQEPTTEKIVHIPEERPTPKEEVYPDLPFFPLGPCSNTLYPTRLHRLHEDLELLGRLASLPPRERKELQRRLPGSLVQAEDKANKMLSDFVENVVKMKGQEAYGQRLKEAMNDQIQIMLALRCYIAAKTVDGPKNKIVVYRNKAMNAWDFFPESARQTMIDPKTGEQTIFINYETNEKAPYKRQMEVSSSKHFEVAKIEDAGPKKIDRLPKQWGDVMDEVLLGFGHEVDNVTEAWILLDQVSKDSTIEERILSKIAYMITHASVHKKNKELPG
jgi:hypothetical protein